MSHAVVAVTCEWSTVFRASIDFMGMGLGIILDTNFFSHHPFSPETKKPKRTESSGLLLVTHKTSLYWTSTYGQQILVLNSKLTC